MVKREFSKTKANEAIEEFFDEIKDKNPKEIKKIKTLSMNYKIPLKEKRKLFCKKCLTPYKNPKIRINNKIKSIECENCGFISRTKLIQKCK